MPTRLELLEREVVEVAAVSHCHLEGGRWWRGQTEEHCRRVRLRSMAHDGVDGGSEELPTRQKGHKRDLRRHSKEIYRNKQFHLRERKSSAMCSVGVITVLSSKDER